eukprot:COSAG02_NODE_907_length_16005_cov_3.219252_4_plen_54_part_00
MKQFVIHKDVVLMILVSDFRATASVQVFCLDNLVPSCYAVALTTVNFSPKLCE